MSNSTSMITETLEDTPGLEGKDVELILTAIGENFSKSMPEINYAGFSIYSILIPEILSQLKLALTLPQPQAIGMGWNIADGVLQIIAGGLQIYSAAKEDTHKPISTGVEGAVNIGSGVQLITLTALSAILGPIGFAVAFGVAASLSMKKTIELTREYVNDDAWFEDKFDQLELFIEKKGEFDERKTNLSNIHKMMYATNQEVSADGNNELLAKESMNMMSIIVFEYLYNRLQEAEANFEKTQNDVFARLVTDYVKRGEKSYLITKMTDNHFDKLMPSLMPSQIESLRKIKNEHASMNAEKQLIDKEKIQDEKIVEDLPKTHQEHPKKQKDLTSRQDRIQNVNKAFDTQELKEKNITYKTCVETTHKVKKAHLEAIKNIAFDTLALFTAFAGMVCLCVPGAQPAAPFLIGFATGYFMGKYGDKAISAIASARSFLKEINEKRNTKRPSNDLTLEESADLRPRSLSLTGKRS